MRPICLKGHERAITYLKYNKEGDLLFTASKDNKPQLWYADTGERIGTYKGHTGSIWSLDVTDDSKFLITGAGDSLIKLWDVPTGQELFTFKNKTPVRDVNFAFGDEMFCAVVDPVAQLFVQSSVLLYKLNPDTYQQKDTPIKELISTQGKITKATWVNNNQWILAATDEGALRLYDTETGNILNEVKEHKKSITYISFEPNHGGYFVTASQDCTAKLFDTRTLKLLKTYTTEKPVNAVAISPNMPFVLVGGGQEAENVTTSHTRTGNFQVRFFHKIYAEEIASVKGHFGPIHTLSFSPDGKSFSSGSEDGYIRIHHFDSAYYNLEKNK